MSMFTPAGVGARKPARRGSGRKLLAAAVVLLLVAGGAGAWWFTQRQPDRVAAAPRPRCPPPAPTPTVMPAARVTVNVYNGTGRRGLAAAVAAELTKRAFTVGKVTNDPLKRKVTGVAEVRSSTVGQPAARTVTAHVGDVVAVPDQRTDASVDLVLGAAFTALRVPAEAAAALTPTPAPRPSGC
jgi:LytR cell envelope-related transcriptional attenuator